MSIQRFFFRGVDEFGSPVWDENGDGDWCHAALAAEPDKPQYAALSPDGNKP